MNFEVDRETLQVWLDVPSSWPRFGGGETKHDAASGEHLELVRDDSYGGSLDAAAGDDGDGGGALLPLVGAAAGAAGTYYAWRAWKAGVAVKRAAALADADALFVAVKAVYDRASSGASTLDFVTFFKALFADATLAPLLREAFATSGAAERALERGALPRDLSRWDALKMFEGRYTSPVRAYVSEVGVELVLDLLAGDATAAKQLVALQASPAAAAAAPAAPATPPAAAPAAPAAPLFDASATTHCSIAVSAVATSDCEEYEHELKVCEGRWYGWSSPWTPFTSIDGDAGVGAADKGGVAIFAGDDEYPVQAETEYRAVLRCRRAAVSGGSAGTWSAWGEAATVTTKRDPAVIAAEVKLAAEVAAKAAAAKAAAAKAAAAKAAAAKAAAAKAKADAKAAAAKAAADARVRARRSSEAAHTADAKLKARAVAQAHAVEAEAKAAAAAAKAKVEAAAKLRAAAEQATAAAEARRIAAVKRTAAAEASKQATAAAEARRIAVAERTAAAEAKAADAAAAATTNTSIGSFFEDDDATDGTAAEGEVQGVKNTKKKKKKKKKQKNAATDQEQDEGGRVEGSVTDLVHEMESAEPSKGHYHHSVTHSDSVALKGGGAGDSNGTAVAAAVVEEEGDAADEDVVGGGVLMHKTAVMKRLKKKTLQLRRSGDFYSHSKRSDCYVLFEAKARGKLTYVSVDDYEGQTGFEVNDSLFIFPQSSSAEEQAAWFNALHVAGYNKIDDSAASAAAASAGGGSSSSSSAAAAAEGGGGGVSAGHVMGHEYHKYISRCKRTDVDRMLSEPQHDRLELAFKSMDISDDGLIDMEELRKYGVLAEQAHAIMHSYDLDDISGIVDQVGMGMLSKTEFIMMVNARASGEVPLKTEGRVATWEHAVATATATPSSEISALSKDELTERIIELKKRVRALKHSEESSAASDIAAVHHEMHQVLHCLAALV